MTEIQRFTRTPPQPFQRDPLPLAPGNLFIRLLAAKTMASLWHCPPADVASKMWPSDRALALLVATRHAPALALRAASAPAMTTVAGWAAELAQRVVADAIEAMGGAAGMAEVLRNCLLLNWSGAGSISAPALVASASQGGFVAEGDPIPVRQFALGPSVLSPFKLASIAVLTREMVESSNAEALISDALARALALAGDAALFDANAATAARPAGLRNGIATTTASTNTDLAEAFAEDIAALVGAVAPVGGSGPYLLVANPGRIAGMEMHRIYSPDSMVRPVASAGIGNIIMVIAPNAVAAAVDPDPDIETAKAATLVMDTAPGVAGTMGPEKEMFQSDSLAVKVRWPVSWVLRDPRGVAWTTPAWK